MREAGLKPFTPDAKLNPVLNAAYTPEGVESGEILDYLLNNHHIQISSGSGELKSSTIRVGHISPVLVDKEIDKLVNALKEFTNG